MRNFMDSNFRDLYKTLLNVTDPKRWTDANKGLILLGTNLRKFKSSVNDTISEFQKTTNNPNLDKFKKEVNKLNFLTSTGLNQIFDDCNFPSSNPVSFHELDNNAHESLLYLLKESLERHFVDFTQKSVKKESSFEK